MEPNECREPYEYAELNEPREPEDLLVSPVSKDDIDGALNTEKLPVLPFELPFRWLVVLLLVVSGGWNVSTAWAMAVMRAGSFSGGECFHRSSGSI